MRFNVRLLASLLLLAVSIGVNAFTQSPKRETRAVWLTTIGGLDWPHTYANTPQTVEKQKAELRAILDKLKRANINTILLQTRIRATVIYPSSIEPSDGCITGVPGKKLPYDPLSFAIEECHKRAMECHAWVVCFPAHKNPLTMQLGKKAIGARIPKLCRKAGDMWMLDPGIPGTDDYLASICAEITQNYDIDGIHLDYIRYPEKEIKFNDATTYAKYGRGENKNDWRRENVTRCVRTISNAVKSIKDWVKISCSPVGKSTDLARFSSNGWNAYKAVYQDAQGWLNTGLMDLLFPMMYFQGNHFYPFAIDWQEEAKGKPVIPGLGIYFLSETEKNWDISIITREMNFLRTIGAGQGFFRSRFFTDNVKGIYDFAENDFYSRPALTQMAGSAGKQLPQSPQEVAICAYKDSILLKWKANGKMDNGGLYYNVYRSDTYPVDCSKAEHLYATRLKETRLSALAIPVISDKYYYAVTSLNRYGIESIPTEANKPQERTTRFLKATKDSIILPEAEATLILIETAEGNVIKTLRYSQRIATDGLPSGIYNIRTFEKNGSSQRLGNFILY